MHDFLLMNDSKAITANLYVVNSLIFAKNTITGQILKQNNSYVKMLKN